MDQGAVRRVIELEVPQVGVRVEAAEISQQRVHQEIAGPVNVAGCA